jgi:predicted histidine transporter YuiF (NhaC family)
LQVQPASEKVLKSYEAKVANYEKEKEVIKKEAEEYETQYKELHEFNEQFEITEALLSISIALFGITALTQKRWLFIFAALISIAGFILGLTAFFKVSLLSDFINRILG